MSNCANPFDWATQSSKHESYIYNNFPMLGELLSYSTGPVDFRNNAENLDAQGRVQYEQEYQQWWKMYGFAWDTNNCPKEATPGETNISGENTWTPGVSDPTIADVKKIQSALAERGYEPGTIDGKWGPNTCGAAYRFKIERLKSYGQNLDWNFFSQLGFAGQTGTDYANKFGNACNAYYSQYVQERSSDVQAIQQALIANGYTLTATGKWDQLTCKALIRFMENTFGSSKKGMADREVFVALGFDSLTAQTFESLYSQKCQNYIGGDSDIVDPTPKKEVPAEVVVPAVVPKKAGFNVFLGLGMAAVAVVGVYLARKS